MDKRKQLFKGIRRIKSLIYAFSVFSFVCLNLSIVACDTSDEVTSLKSEPLSAGVSNEFIYNYELLHFFYIHQDKYLDKPETYIGKADEEALFEKGIPWDYYDIYYMYSQMNDPYTYYLDPSIAASLLNSLNNSEEKIGAGFVLDSSLVPNKYVIKNVIKNSPADKSGIKAGDEIIEIEGIVPTSEIAFRRLAVGVEGETITYTIKRDSATKKIPVVIAHYFMPTLELTFMDSIPIIKINEFTGHTSNDSGSYGEFKEILRETKNYPTTIIDLRDNGGGDADQCFAMTQELLSKGDTTVAVIEADADTVLNKQIFDTTYYINEFDGMAKDRYFVFLANEMTASCSEIMIAGVVSNKKYPVIGTTTYGKGIGQSQMLTPSYSLASITRLQIIDKQKLTYHKYGIEPDFAIRNDKQALNKAVALAKEQNFVRVAGYGNENTGHFAKMGTAPDTMPGFYFLPKEYRKKF